MTSTKSYFSSPEAIFSSSLSAFARPFTTATFVLPSSETFSIASFGQPSMQVRQRMHLSMSMTCAVFALPVIAPTGQRRAHLVQPMHLSGSMRRATGVLHLSPVTCAKKLSVGVSGRAAKLMPYSRIMPMSSCVVMTISTGFLPSFTFSSLSASAFAAAQLMTATETRSSSGYLRRMSVPQICMGEPAADSLSLSSGWSHSTCLTQAGQYDESTVPPFLRVLKSSASSKIVWYALMEASKT